MLPTVNLTLVLFLPFLAGIGAPLASAAVIAVVVYIEALICLGSGAAAKEWRSRNLASTIAFLGIVCTYGLIVTAASRLPLENFLDSAVRFALIVLAYVVGVHWVRCRDPRGLIVAVALCCVAFSASGVVFKLAGVGVEVGNTIRYRGLAATINNLALYSALGIVISLYLLSSALPRPGERKWLMAIAVCGAGLLASGSLGPMLAVLAAVLVLARARGHLTLRAALLGAGVGSLMILLAYAGPNEYLAGRVSSALDTNLLADGIGDPENSIEWRILHWSLLLERWWQDFAWFGAGLGQQAELSVFRTMSGGGYAAHNDFIGLLVELGFIGFSMVSVFAAWALGRGVFRHPLVRGVVALFVVAGLSAPTIATGAVQYYAPLIFAACVVEVHRRRQGEYGREGGVIQAAVMRSR